MLIWIGIATAWVACLAVVVVLAARAPIMDEDPDLAERAERIAEREAWCSATIWMGRRRSGMYFDGRGGLMIVAARQDCKRYFVGA